MKNFWLGTVCGFCFSMAGGVRAEVVVFPFIDACGPEISEYCYGVAGDGLPDCMAAHEEFLGGDCLDAVEVFDRERWGWDPAIHARWADMSLAEREAFRADHRDEMLSRGGFQEAGFARGGHFGGRMR